MTITKTGNTHDVTTLFTKPRSESKQSSDAFSEMLSRLMAKGGAASLTTHSAPDASSARNEQLTLFNNRTDSDYMDFWNNAIGRGSITVPPQYYTVEQNGEKILSDEGIDYLKKSRVENAMTLAPKSIEEAKSLYATSYQHLKCSLNTVLENSGCDVSLTMSGGNLTNYMYAAGFNFMDSSQGDAFMKYFYKDNDYGYLINGMTEETAFYGAIVNLAESNCEFRNAYDHDPESALTTYYSEIVDEMLSIRPPNATAGKGGAKSGLEFHDGFEYEPTLEPGWTDWTIISPEYQAMLDEGRRLRGFIG